jgi:hypothetical protein
MPRASCRCGQTLTVPSDGTDRVVCPKCGARVRVRRRAAGTADGYLRFYCPCGRRLKVSAAQPPTHGKCPDCGRVVPVPKTGMGGKPSPETDTEDLSPQDVAALKQWSERHLTARDEQATPPVIATFPPTTPTTRAEAGLRVCPNCGKPVHLGANTCRACGTPVPRK